MLIISVELGKIPRCACYHQFANYSPPSVKVLRRFYPSKDGLQCQRFQYLNFGRGGSQCTIGELCGQPDDSGADFPEITLLLSISLLPFPQMKGKLMQQICNCQRPWSMAFVDLGQTYNYRSIVTTSAETTLTRARLALFWECLATEACPLAAVICSM